MLIAELNQRSPTVDKPRDLFSMRQPGKMGIGNRIYFWQIEAHEIAL